MRTILNIHPCLKLFLLQLENALHARDVVKKLLPVIKKNLNFFYWCIEVSQKTCGILKERKCTHRGTVTNSPFHNTIETLPTVLIIHLKRFRNDSTKITNHVQLNQTIHPNDFGIKARKLVNYNRVSVIDHQSNTITDGHYISKINSQYRWRMYNSSVIQEINESSLCSGNSYMDFYQLGDKKTKHSKSVMNTKKSCSHPE